MARHNFAFCAQDIAEHSQSRRRGCAGGNRTARRIKSAFLGLAAVAIFSPAIVGLSPSSAAANASLKSLTGAWRGGGQMSFESGKPEPISCNAYYKGDDNFSVVIRCKGTSSNFELRSKFTSSGDKISGSWEERTYNASGDASGSASPGKLNVQFGGSLAGSLAMNFSSSNLTVSVSVDTKGAGIKGVSVNLRRA